ncbi:phasin family protein [Paenibacillus massiliensis]|uniref:phasin family protein n=1 Tax=Paenibacillus massiliensis TaxID=225917 RepID=UPI00046F89B9|nr:phasin family protein [Paenibacillus massiliensis]
MSDLLKRAISLGWGLTVVSKEKVERIVDDLVKRGELAPTESKALIERLMSRGEEDLGHVKTLVREQIARGLEELDVPSQKDIRALEQRIAVLESQIAELKQGQSLTTAEAAVAPEVPVAEEKRSE